MRTTKTVEVDVETHDGPPRLVPHRHDLPPLSDQAVWETLESTRR